jgi:hypothetical protein
MKLNSGKAIRLTHSFSLASAAAPVLQLSTAVALPSGHFHPIIKLFFSLLLFSFFTRPTTPSPLLAARPCSSSDSIGLLLHLPL